MEALWGIDWKPWVFAAKTTVAGLLALLIAFAFDLDQPQWTLLTVFIIAQPRRSGAVLAKSFYRIIGTLIGAVVALLLVGLAAQERILFLGALALWIGGCTFGSQYARSWSAYSFVLSGYTAAIIGIPGALDPGNAFYTAVARVTEIGLGIVIGTTITHLVLPDSMVGSLREALGGGRRSLSAYAVSVLNAAAGHQARAGLLRHAMATEDLLNSAVFEDRQVRAARDVIRGLAGAPIDILACAQPLEHQLAAKDGDSVLAAAGFDQARVEAAAAIAAWDAKAVDAAGLGRCLARLDEGLVSPQPAPDTPADGQAELAERAVLAGRLNAFLAAFADYAMAFEAFAAGRSDPRLPPLLDRSVDGLTAALIGLAAALAVGLTGTFWILTAWPRGSTATVLAALATSRVATMGQAVPLAIATSMTFSLSAIPAFFVIEMVLPLASGFAMLVLAVGPMLFLFALLMAYQRTMIIGYMSALLFITVGAFQDQMTYDPMAFVNTTISALVAVGVTLVLWAVLVPDTPQGHRRRFVRAARGAQQRLFAAGARGSLIGFERAMGGALAQFARRLRPDRPEDHACLEAGIALLGAGRELIQLRQAWRSPPVRARRRPLAAAGDHIEGPDPDCQSLRCADAAFSDCIAAMSSGRDGTDDLGLATQKLGAVMDALARRSVAEPLRLKVHADAA